MAQLTRQDWVLAAGHQLRRKIRSERYGNLIALWIGIGIIGLIVVVSLLAPLFGWGNPDRQNLSAALLPPSLDHPFGTDDLGRDLLSRVLAGTKVDLTVAIVTTYVPLVVGVLVGAVAGYFGGWIDSVIMRLTDIVMAFPFMVLVLAMIAVFGPGLPGVFVGLTIVGWALYARLTRGEVLVLRERQFVLAARTLGYHHWRILGRHVIPNVIRPSLVFSMADIVLNILVLSTLSFLGLGVQPPTPEWGAIVAEGQNYMLSAWWIATLPGLVIVITGVGFSLIGDALSDRLGREVPLVSR
jgi:peptide/nickel transport system permease protein